MKWIVYGAYRRDTPAIPLTFEAPNAAYAKRLFFRKHPQMYIVRIEKAGATEAARKEDWYNRSRKPKYGEDSRNG